MSPALFLLGKFKKLISAAATASNSPLDVAAFKNRLYVYDKATHYKYLVDSGSDICCLPASLNLKSRPSSIFLYAANGSKIPTYGQKLIDINLGLRRNFQWTFVIADVSTPIIGADFLKHFGLILDLKNNRLLDSVTQLTATGQLIKSAQTAVKLISDDIPYHKLLQKFPHLTSPIPKFNNSIKHDTVHYIETTGAPIYSKPRRLHPKVLDAVKKEFQYLIDQGICRPSKSPWASPIHVVKKPDGSYRVCGDYRRLNSITTSDRYPLPHIHDVTNVLHGKKIFSKIDIVRAYFHIPINETDIPKTALTTPFGSFEFLFLNFGLKCAPMTFQRFMNEVLQNLDFAICYLDDVLIFSDNEDEHIKHVQIVLERLHKYGLNINASKSLYAQKRISFLGHEITSDGIRPLDQKVQAIINYPKPQNLMHLRKFLGLLNFYRRFVKNAADLLAPLTDLLKGSKLKNDRTLIKWTDDLTQSFEQSKQALSTATLLSFPSKDGDLILHSDASNIAIGATLSTLEDQHCRPLAFFSKRLNEAQCKYSSFDRELLAIYEACKFFRHLLEARPCKIITDHKPLIYAFRKQTDKYTNRQSRWLSFISEFSTDISYLKGESNEAADALSRVNEIQTPSVIDYEELSRAQQNDQELKKVLEEPDSSLNFKQITFPNSTFEIFCDLSTGKARPYVPKNFRKQVFLNLHRLSHPGIRSTVNLIRQRFVWPSINKDCRNWARECLDCQRAKINRHTKTELGTFDLPTQRFQHIHCDLIGPLPESHGKRYCLTVIDRATRWPEAYPISDITAQTVAQTLYTEWIARFGTPERITTDQGRQFESELFRQLSKLLGIEKLRTSPYNPKANGLVENWHRPLKAAIKAHKNNSWTEVLPTILLGFRASLKEDLNATPAELVYGSTLRLPGDFFDSSTSIKDPSIYVAKLREHFQSFKPKPTKVHSRNTVFVHKELDKCSHVFVRCDTVRRSLQPPYDGPFPIVSRNDKTFTLLVKGKPTVIRIDRLKPAFIAKDDEVSVPATTQVPDGVPLPTSPLVSDHGVPDPALTQTTRSGRHVRFPDRLNYELRSCR